MTRTRRLPEIAAIAPELTAIALRNVDTEFPTAPQYVLESDRDLRAPRDIHPIFFGSYDWHSSVHMHWLLVSLLDRVDPETRERVETRLDAAFRPASSQLEADYLNAHPMFERPYGWAWALLLAAAIRQQAEDAARPDPRAARWARDLAPLAEAIAALTRRWLRVAAGPVRHGVHANTAFALATMLEAARALELGDLTELIAERSRDWFAGDHDYPVAWEPSGQDFLSPALAEADLMCLVLEPRERVAWLERFLPDLFGLDAERSGRNRAAVSLPVSVRDAGDGQQGHLYGLNLSRAAHLYRLARVSPLADPVVTRLRESAERHLDAGLPHVRGGFIHEHWLATYAYLALRERGIPPD